MARLTGRFQKLGRLAIPRPGEQAASCPDSQLPQQVLGGQESECLILALAAPIQERQRWCPDHLIVSEQLSAGSILQVDANGHEAFREKGLYVRMGIRHGIQSLTTNSVLPNKIGQHEFSLRSGPLTRLGQIARPFESRHGFSFHPSARRALLLLAGAGCLTVKLGISQQENVPSIPGNPFGIG